jgi:hypothetical protein
MTETVVYIDIDTIEANFPQGEARAVWSGYVVEIDKKPVLSLGNKHIMTYALDVPYGVRGRIYIKIFVEPTCVACYLPFLMPEY